MPEGAKKLGVPVVIGRDILPSPVGIGLIDLPFIYHQSYLYQDGSCSNIKNTIANIYKPFL